MKISNIQEIRWQLDGKPQLFGIDFTSAPGKRKPIMVASGRLDQNGLVVKGLEPLDDFVGFEEFLSRSGPWVGGFDLPFGLPRELVEQFGWPTEWSSLIRLYAGLSRTELRNRFKNFCDVRDAGNKFAHRQTDRPAGSSPSMKWVNPPVAWMLHAGAIRLLDSGVTIPGMLDGDPQRIALEAYPGLPARSVTRESYKSDDPRRQTDQRRLARTAILTAVLAGDSKPGIKTRMSRSLQNQVLADGSGDALDAVLCLVQVAWGLNQKGGRFGLPDRFDPLEGWIIGAA